jgi:hypothetical protein
MRSVLAVTLVLSACASARADAIPPQPPCMDGAERRIDGHEVIYCAPNTCRSDTDCTEGRVCRDAGLCIAHVTRSVAQSFPAMPGEPMVEVSYDEATSVCAPGSACAVGSCVTARRCVARPASLPPSSPSAPSAAPDAPGSGCGAAPGTSAARSGGLALPLFGLAAYGGRAIRASRRSRHR